MTDILDSFARRLRSDHTFLASALEDYARSEGLNGPGLARRLGISPEDLGRLAICRRPSGERFNWDIDVIARRFAIDQRLLADVVHQADYVEGVKRVAKPGVAHGRPHPAATDWEMVSMSSAMPAPPSPLSAADVLHA